MDIELRPIDQIQPYPGNPRQITEEAVRATANSIKEFGWRQPIVVDSDGVIIVGHTRLMAAQSLGLNSVPVHVMECTEDQARAYRLADNKAGEQANWDVLKLGEELRELGDFNMPDFGFADIEVEMAKIDELGVMTGEQVEPWGGSHSDYVSDKIEEPRCIVKFGTEEAQALFFAWLETQDANFRKQQSKNETYVAYMPAREQNRFEREGEEDQYETEGE